MNKYEELARKLKESNNCSYSVYNAFKDVLTLSGNIPAPRSIDGKCGALLAALQILDETGNSDKKEQFEKDFINEFQYSKCVDLMSHERMCFGYSGWCAKRISELLKNEISN